MIVDYTAILTRQYPGKEWTLNGDTYDGLTWLSDGNPPTQAELDVAWPAVKAEIEAEQAAKETARTTALAKLGLTPDEIAALFG